ncbi:lipopolysaccharide biosynthesis protein [Vibrio sp. 10N.222.51.E8]|uniref:lipopolysaccharide biosynthesis protein n=1 Tax=unclassified Vibrio TaxID=2614977 RepID=UPI0010BD82C1|nr:lipopolysaccharide biosynthesis protein [Vibrio sp. F13]TKG26978.1 lipopolysaccharide biosynthesis protein [Vibrio sp. F13]
MKKILSKSLFLFVVLPFLIFVLYQIFIAPARYESSSRVIVKEPDGISTMDPSMALLSGLGVSTANTDIQVVKLFIESMDMLEYLDSKLNLFEHFSSEEFSVLGKPYQINNKDDLYNIFLRHTKVEIDEPSGAILITFQAYTSEFSQQVNNEIVRHSETFINSIGQQLARSQLDFINEEHALIEKRLNQSKLDLLEFQYKYNLLDPEAEGVAIQSIAYELEANVAKATVELKSLSSIMSENSPVVLSKKNELDALKQQLDIERNRLSKVGENGSNILSSILSEYSDLKIKLEMNLKSYISSQISLEKSRVEAYRQIKHLVVIQSPTLPMNNKYPEVGYNSLLSLIILTMIYSVSRIVMSTIKELS